MQVTIEFEVKDEYEAEKLRRYASYINNPDWVASWWSIWDIHEQANGWDGDESNAISDDEAREVLRLMDKYHDCEVGINWEVIDSWIDHVKQLRKEVA